MLLNVKLTIGEGRFFLITVCFWMPTYWRPFKKSRNDSLVARKGRWSVSDKWCSIGCTWIKLMSGLVQSSEFRVPSSEFRVRRTTGVVWLKGDVAIQNVRTKPRGDQCNISCRALNDFGGLLIRLRSQNLWTSRNIRLLNDPVSNHPVTLRMLCCQVLRLAANSSLPWLVFGCWNTNPAAPSLGWGKVPEASEACPEPVEGAEGCDSSRTKL